jgi:hypothetical protein
METIIYLPCIWLGKFGYVRLGYSKCGYNIIVLLEFLISHGHHTMSSRQNKLVIDQGRSALVNPLPVLVLIPVPVLVPVPVLFGGR